MGRKRKRKLSILEKIENKQNKVKSTQRISIKNQKENQKETQKEIFPDVQSLDYFLDEGRSSEDEEKILGKRKRDEIETESDSSNDEAKPTKRRKSVRFSLQDNQLHQYEQNKYHFKEVWNKYDVTCPICKKATETPKSEETEETEENFKFEEMSEEEKKKLKDQEEELLLGIKKVVKEGLIAKGADEDQASMLSEINNFEELAQMAEFDDDEEEDLGTIVCRSCRKQIHLGCMDEVSGSQAIMTENAFKIYVCDYCKYGKYFTKENNQSFRSIRQMEMQREKQKKKLKGKGTINKKFLFDFLDEIKWYDKNEFFWKELDAITSKCENGKYKMMRSFFQAFDAIFVNYKKKKDKNKKKKKESEFIKGYVTSLQDFLEIPPTTKISYN